MMHRLKPTQKVQPMNSEGSPMFAFFCNGTMFSHGRVTSRLADKLSSLEDMGEFLSNLAMNVNTKT
jgi:hypothetical protein